MIADKVRISNIKKSVEPFFIINKGEFNDRQCDMELEPSFDGEDGFYNNGLMYIETYNGEVKIFYDGSMVGSSFPTTSTIKIKANTDSDIYTTIETSWRFTYYENFSKNIKNVEEIYIRVGHELYGYKLFTEDEIIQNVQDNESSIINIQNIIKIKPISDEVDIDIVFPFDWENTFTLDCFIESLVLY